MKIRRNLWQANVFAIGLPILCAAVLFGRAVGPDFQRPTPIADPTYTPAPQPAATAQAEGPGGAAQKIVEVESIGGAWWQAFGSADLDRLVQQALEESPTLVEARMRLEQARHDYLAQAGTLFPQINGTLNATRETTNPAAFGVANLPNSTSPPFTLYQAQVNVTYTLDLFGANRRALEGLAAQIDYQQYELEAARLTLAGNVVTSVVRRASLAAQIDLSERILAAQVHQFQIAELRYRAGGIAEADVLSQRSQVEQTRAGIAPLRAQLAQADHQLAVYLGRTPAQGTASVPDLDGLALPTELPLTLPSTLARQRPDIRASEALLHQAGANVGVATANLYPQITLTGNIGSEGTLLSALPTVWSIGAGLTQPLFHGGQLRARKRSAQDAYEAALDRARVHAQRLTDSAALYQALGAKP